ncbi:MAG: serine/threonine-protein kinase [Polyangiaceae bacterium]
MSSLSAQRLRDSLIGTAIVGDGGVRFHLRTLLGEGGQGWVFKANYDDPDGFWIVVKMLRQEGLNQESLLRFERETKVLQMLGAVATPNPNIVRFYDHGIVRLTSPLGEIALPFIALEFVDGPTLASLIERHGGQGMALTTLLPLMKQVARALATVHEQRIVHRDLKPSNILLATVQGQHVAKVTDFGLVKMTDLSAKATATVAGASLGYAPPEQYEMGNNRVGPPTDIFSYATILYEMLTGRAAFPHNPGESPLKTVARMLTGDRPQLANALVTISPELRGCGDLVKAIDVELERATNADPMKRHTGILDFWARVEVPLREAQRRQRSSGVSNLGSARPPVMDEVSYDPAHARPPQSRIAAAPPPRFAPIAPPMQGERLRSVAFLPEDATLIAAGSAGIYRFTRSPGGSAWTMVSRPEFVGWPPPTGVARLSTGEVLLYGDRGLAMSLSRDGVVRPVIAADPDVHWLGAHTEDGDIILVGARHSRVVGVLAEISQRGTHIRNLEGTQRLVSITRLASGTFIACGPGGELVHVVPTALAESPSRASHQEVPWGRTGHLFSVCRAFDGGAFAVGSGGHALRIAPPGLSIAEGRREPPVATLEVVQTTRDLTHVVLDGRGIPWCVGAAARLLVRDAGTWVRIALSMNEVPLVALHISNPPGRGNVLTLVAEDGAIVEGA